MVRRLLADDRVRVLLLGALLFLPGLGAHDLWNPDEPRYAEVAREMVDSGTLQGWLVPHLNGELYAQKPPLLFWSIALVATLLGGYTEFAVRLPVALAGVACLLAIFDMGRRLFDRRAAWIAVAVFGTCINLMLQARTAQIDMLLVALVAWAMRSWLHGYLDDQPRRSWSFFGWAGLATLAKGPVGLLPPLFSILAFLGLTRQFRRMRDLRLPSGFAIYILVVLAWLVPAALAGGEEYWKPILLKQNVERFANPWHHLRPWYYYLQILPTNFFPWSFLLPGALLIGWRGADDQSRRGVQFALCWIAVTLLFFSLSPGKRTVYILTMYPALALLIGATGSRLAAEAGRRSRQWLLWPLGLLLGLAATLATMAVAVGLDPSLAGDRPILAVLGPDFPWRVALLFFLFAIGLGFGVVQAWRRRFGSAIAGMAAGSGAAGLVAVLLVAPAFDVVKSARGLSDRYLELAAENEPYGIYPRIDPPFLFYTGRFAEILDSEQALRDFAARESRVWVFARRRFLDKIDLPDGLREVARDRDPSNGYALLTNEPFPAALE